MRATSRAAAIRLAAVLFTLGGAVACKGTDPPADVPPAADADAALDDAPPAEAAPDTNVGHAAACVTSPTPAPFPTGA